MRPVVYSMTVSLDGYTTDADGSIDWTAPDEELFDVHVEQTRDLAAHLCGRRLYEDMLVWETADAPVAFSRAREFARLWTAVPKVVFSTTLDEVQGNATLATGTVAEELARVRDGPDGHVSVGGARFAAALVQQDLIDEYRLFVAPVVLGGGTPFFPDREEQLDLDLVESRTFGSHIVYLRYRRRRAS